MSHVHAVILAGGSGTRFWPASRRKRPKQLLPLAGDPNEPLIAATARRIAPLVPIEHLWISTSAALVAPTLAALPGVAASRALAEPVARNTAPCIGWACATIARSDPDAIIAVLPADHHIADEPAFREALTTALRAAEEGWMATIGIVPTRAETGYGYIEVGDAVAPGVHAAAAFVEKPNRERAEGYLRGGKHLWNGGMFFFRASVMRKAIAKHLPALAAGLDRIDAAAASGDEARALAEVFPTLPSISIDHGVMEKAEKIAVIPGSFGWNDVGSWQVAWDMAHKDSAGNVLPVGAVAVDAKNNLVVDLTTATGNANGKADTKADTKTWALVGVNDLVVVETDDAVLVIPRERAQDVRAVVDALTARGRADRT